MSFLICCAVCIMQVMISTCVQKIPESMIMQRWTKHARHVVPADLSQYKKENPDLLAQTHRHSSLVLKVLRFVEMGDRNPQSHILAMKIIDDGMEALREVSKERDGFGLADRTVENLPEFDLEGNDQFPLREPARRPKRGRPTVRRDKAPHEGLSKRPQFCKICRSDEHNCQSCPDRDRTAKKPRRPPTCSGCGLSGHIKDRCHPNQQQLAAVDNLFL